MTSEATSFKEPLSCPLCSPCRSGRTYRWNVTSSRSAGHPECDVRLGSLRVSRRHCIITTDRGDVVVRDLGSTNGTWINGRRVAAAQIRPGDEVSIADVRYVMEKAPPLRAVVADLPSRLDDE